MSTTTTAGDLTYSAVFIPANEAVNEASSFLVTAPPPVPSVSLQIVGFEGSSEGESVEVTDSLRRLEEVAAVPPNWDSYGSEPPTQTAVSVAKKLIHSVARLAPESAGAAAVPFSIAPLSGGGVQIEWRKGGSTIEVEVNADGRLGYLQIVDSDEGRKYQEAEEVSDDFLVALISSVVLG